MEKTQVNANNSEPTGGDPDGKAAPAGAKDNSERLFSQAEVDKIVESRLARYKDKVKADGSGDPDVAARDADLTARESKISCWEYVIEKGYPRDLLDIIGTSDVEQFKAKADKLAELQMPGYPSTKDGGSVIHQMVGDEEDDIARAFSRDNKHVPKAPKQRW